MSALCNTRRPRSLFVWYSCCPFEPSGPNLPAMSDAPIRFVHFADVHLGFRQYGLAERAADFVRAFDDAVDYCLRVAPDFVVIAGDLFDSKSIEPSTYAAADIALERLARAGIPVVANEGNHERWFRRGERSWLWQLSRHGRLRLLRQFDPLTGRLQARPWTSERGFGAYTDIGAGPRLRRGVPRRAPGGPHPGNRRLALRPAFWQPACRRGHPAHRRGRSRPPGRRRSHARRPGPHPRLHRLPGAGPRALRLRSLPEGNPWIFNPGALEAHNILEGLAGQPARARAGPAASTT